MGRDGDSRVGRVLAANHAEVVLTGNVASAGLASWDLGSEREVGLLTVPVAATLVAWNLLADFDGSPLLTSAVAVDHAGEGTSTIGVDLVNSHLELTALADLRKLVTGEVHDGLGTSLGLVVACAKGLAEALGGVTSEAGAVLLEWVAPSAITRSVGVDTEGHAGTTLVTDSINNSAVAIDSPAGGQDGEENLRRCSNHFE